MVKDGVFGPGTGIAYGEHLVPIKLRFGSYLDEFDWDITNSDNSPEEFAAGLVADLDLAPQFKWPIAFEIRK